MSSHALTIPHARTGMSTVCSVMVRPSTPATVLAVTRRAVILVGANHNTLRRKQRSSGGEVTVTLITAAVNSA